MTVWTQLLIMFSGNVVFFCFQVLYFRWKERRLARKRAAHMSAKDGEQSLKFEMMWKDFKERKKINGGEWRRGEA